MENDPPHLLEAVSPPHLTNCLVKYVIADCTEEQIAVAADARRDSENALNFAARSRLELSDDCGASSSTSALRLDA